jgi:dTDP-4-amino-4,6-dideoxygalactose transaminase
VSHSQNNHSQNIPFLDLVTPHAELEQELTAVFQQVIRTAGFIGGPMVENFEKEFAAFCHTERAVAVNSGTDALRFALMAAGVKPGDVVVTVPHTFIATTEAISQAGVCRHRRAHLQHGSGETAHISGDAVQCVGRRQTHQ